MISFVMLWVQLQRPAPEQPLPFSHKTHVAQKLVCKQCHAMPDPGDFATLPETSVCMNCHTAIKKESPHIVKLVAFHNDNKKIPWARVYRIPDYVFFNHKAHISAADMTCASCHGPVEERAALRREKEISMQACMECHRTRMVSVACNFCHDPK